MIDLYKPKYLRAFVPAKDYQISRKFYQRLGFKEQWATESLALYEYDSSSFYLQNFYIKDYADNFMMSIFVDNVDLLWLDLQALNLEIDFPGVRLAAPKDYDWGLREIHIIDPTGVLWHLANI